MHALPFLYKPTYFLYHIPNFDLLDISFEYTKVIAPRLELLLVFVVLLSRRSSETFEPPASVLTLEPLKNNSEGDPTINRVYARTYPVQA